MNFLQSLAQGAQRLGGVVAQDASKAWAQVNPLDNGRTWQNPQGNAPQQQAQGQPAPSAWQQLSNSGAAHVITPIATSIYNDGANALDVLNAGRQGLQGLVPISVAALTNNPQAEANAIYKTNAAMNYSLNASRGLLTPNEAQNASLFGNAQQRMDFFNPVGRGVLRYAPYAMGGDLANLGVKTATGVTASLMPRATGRYLAASALGFPEKLAGQAAGRGFTGAVHYGGSTLGGGLANTAFGASQDVQHGATPAQLVKDLPINFAAGGALGLGGRGVADLTKFAVNKAASTPLNEVGAVGKDVRPIGPDANAPLPKPQTVAQNSLTKGVKDGRQNLSPELGSQVSGEHFVRNTQALSDASNAAVSKLPLSKSIEQSHSFLAQPLGHVNDQQTGFIAKAIEAADMAATKARQAGNTTRADRLTREAAALHDGLSEHAVARGQANQALTMLYNRSPQGLYYSALRDLKRAGVQPSTELQTKLQGLADAVRNAPDSKARVDAVAVFHKSVSNLMPQHLSDKLIGIWKAGLLSGVKTQQGNAISNATFAALKKVSDVPAAGADKLMSVFNGHRAKTLTPRGSVSGTVEGFKNGAFTMKTGIDRRSAGDKYEQHAEIDFKNPILAKTIGNATKLVFRGMNAADQPFWYAAYKNSMYDQAKAAGINQGLKGAELRAFMDNSVKNPTEKMANTALTEANKSTLNYDTIASRAVQSIHTAIDNAKSLNGRPIPQAYRDAAHAVISVLAPFVRVPTAFLSRTVDFTLLGTGREVFQQIANKQFDQRALSQAIGEGLTGTGAIALGIALAQNNMISGNYPKNDPKEAQRWKAQGVTPNSVKIGGKWLSLNYLGPLGLLFNAGYQLESSKGESAYNRVGTALAGLGQGLMGQSFLQGFSGFSNAIQDPNRSLKSFVNSQTGSVVPNIVNDVANVTDQWQRQVNTPLQAIESRLPGIRHNLLIKQDVYGNPLQQAAGVTKIGGITIAPNTLIGVKPSNDLTNKNPVIAEVSRLHGVNPQDKNLQVTPSPVGRKITVNGQQVVLSDTQRYNLQKQVGQTIQSSWGQIIQTPAYQAASDMQKAAMLNYAKTYATEHAQRNFMTSNSLASYSKPESNNAKALASGNLPQFNTNGKPTLGTTNLTPQQKYQADQQKYQQAKANGTLTQYQDYKAQQTLAREAVMQNYSKDLVGLYGMSKSSINNYLQNDPYGQQTYAKLQALDQQLYQAGLSNGLKFKNGLSTARRGRSTGGRRTSGGSRVARSSRTTGQSTSSRLARGFLKSGSQAASIKLTSNLNKRVAKASTKVGRLPKYSKGTTKLAQYKIKSAKISNKRGLA